MTKPVLDPDLHVDLHVELLEERLQLSKRVIELGRILVETRVETTQQMVEALLAEEEVHVARTVIGQFVDEVPQIREEDGVLIIPVLEEQMVMRTQLVLKEELRIKRTTSQDLVRQVVPLRSEVAIVTRQDEPAFDAPIVLK